jgi:hypothetical protein
MQTRRDDTDAEMSARLRFLSQSDLLGSEDFTSALRFIHIHAR